MKTDINLIFTMAGKYKRFKPFGANVPKYLMPLGSSTILDTIISMTASQNSAVKLFFIANKDDQIFFPIVKSILIKNKIELDRLIYIDDTNSQLETALHSKHLSASFDRTLPVCFANIDTITHQRSDFFSKLSYLQQGEGLIDAFLGSNDNYSYLRMDDAGRVLKVADQKIISEFACSGLYGFSSFDCIEKMALGLLDKKPSANFTDVYNAYIDQNYVVCASISQSPRDTIVLGTPAEYILNIHRF